MKSPHLLPWLGLALLLYPSSVHAEGDFETSIKPLLSQYCLGCHSTEKQKGDLDLEQFGTVPLVKSQPKIWQSVVEQITLGEMPPKDKAQPKREERDRLLEWVRGMLREVALSQAGDPGPVTLRRLSNAEYTYTIRDLTEVNTLDPAREFPVDGAAGEGFTNTGNSLVMSPSLFTKYLDAAKSIASHAVLTPEGFHFSGTTTRRDWTDETLARIRSFYAKYTESSDGTKVDLQGIKFATNEGGRLPVEKYLAATMAERDPLASGEKTLEALAKERGLNANYLRLLWSKLMSNESSLLLDGIRAKWKGAATEALANDIAAWQGTLWRFTSVGHIGKLNGPKSWLEPVTPLAEKHEIRVKIAPKSEGTDVLLYLTATDAGDGGEHDRVIWENPRIEAPGQQALSLRDVRGVVEERTTRREIVFAHTAKVLGLVAEVSQRKDPWEARELADRAGVPQEALKAWLRFLGVGPDTQGPQITSHLAKKITKSAGYDFVNGWGSNETPNLVANSSNQAVRIPGNLKAHGVVVHPSPTLRIGVAWQSPIAGQVSVSSMVQHAHPECGNGITWSLELRRGATRQRLASGATHGSKEVPAGPFENLAIQKGDLLSLLIGPRDGNHSCDLTAVDLRIRGAGEEWDLAKEISPDVLANNPHADSSGREGIWHFYTEPDKGGGDGPVIPEGSFLAKWLAATAEQKPILARELQRLLQEGPGKLPKDSPDLALFRQLNSLGGLLLRDQAAEPRASDSKSPFGLDPQLFGKDQEAEPIGPIDLAVSAPSLIEIRLPADLVDGGEFVTTGHLQARKGAEGSVQLQVLTTKPEAIRGITPAEAKEVGDQGVWTNGQRPISHSAPVIVMNGSAARARMEQAFQDFRELFPPALCYTKIVPVDEVVTLTLFYREDQHLGRLMLDAEEQARLDRLWAELHFVSLDALTLVDAYEQLWQFATQDADPKVFEPLREPILQRAADFRRELLAAEPKQMEALLAFATKAYRRPLQEVEAKQLRQLYAKMRTEELSHEEAFRLTLARVLSAPAFLYRLEAPAPGPTQAPVSAWELANRLSYFLWSSLPDAALRNAAETGALLEPSILQKEADRMLRDPRVRRLGVEFACQWLHIRDFDSLDEKSERHFPTFQALRGDMYEETIRFFTDLFQRGGSILEILEADHSFLNEALAKHYGMENIVGQEWRRVDGLRRLGRGGILAQATTLAKQSGASRTSPILRGNWVSEVLLGEKLPRPPKDVPQLPEDEATETLTMRQLVERHSNDRRCSGCHVRIDPFGFALEGFDAIGRARLTDLGGRPIDTKTALANGPRFEGLEGLRSYLSNERRDTFLRQFCRKLLGYALGRAIQLSDEPLLEDVMAKLKVDDYRFSTAVHAVLSSRQFREIRGKDWKE